jgi:Zn-dependent protease with chaperone function
VVKSLLLSLALLVSLLALGLPAIAQPERGRDAAAQADAERAPVRVPEPTEKALQFYRSGNRLWVLNHAWAIGLPAVLACSGLSARLGKVARRLGRVWFFTIGVYVVMYLAVVFVLELPLAYYEEFVRLHAYGLSNQTLGKWLGDSAKSLVVAMVGGFLFAWVPYLLLARSPRRWWLYTAILSIPFLFFVMLVAPIWIDPCFNRFGPMKNKALERSILALAARAGIDGSRVFEVDKSVDTNAVNAYVKGVFSTKRIVLWDTLIAKLDEPELLFVMGHEMGHYCLGHVVRSILLSGIVTLAGLFMVDWLGRRLVARYPRRLGFKQLADVASLPLLLMLLEVAFLVLSPVALAYSRMQEHEADQFALDLTRTNRAGAMSFVKLQEENLSNPRPGRLFQFLRASHPSIGERIDYCNTYHPWISGAKRATAGEEAVSSSPIGPTHH